MTVQIIRQGWDPKLQVDVVDYAGLAAERDTVPVLTEGSSFYASDTKATYISGALGWTVKPAAAAQSVAFSGAIPAGDNNIGNVDVVTLPALPAGTNNIGKVTLEGEIPAGTKNIGDVDVASLPGTVAADIGETKRQLTGPVLFPMSGAATHAISATAAQLISFVLQAANAGIITVKDGDTTLLTFAAGALAPGQAVFIGAMMINPKIVFAGADVGVATYIPTAS